MRIQVLGPLQVIDDGGSPVALGGPRQQTVLAVLVAFANETVSVDRLIDEIWGEAPPQAARNSLQSMISNLRKAIATDGIAIDRQDPGYVLRAADAAIDARAFAAALDEARGVVESDPLTAADALGEALALWRGVPYAGLADEVPVLRSEVTRLDELRLRAIGYRIESDLGLGRHGEVVGELEGLIVEHPLHEEFTRLHMLALYRSGRQAEALRSFGRLRRTLADELGIDPSPELQQLEQQILEHDPGLHGPADAAARTERPNPYKGLLAFGEDDAADFFGRDDLVAELVQRISDAGPGGFTALVGPSGAGKSSVVNAGLVPAIREGAIDGSERWLVARMYPGSRPFEELEAALVKAAPGSPPALLEVLTDEVAGLRRAARLVAPDEGTQLVLVIDQFEELFTLTSQEERRRFIRLLVEGLTDERSRLRVLVTMRSDFLGEPLSHPQLADLLRAGTALVPPMGAAELEQAVVGPAERVGVEVDASLLVAAVSDVEGNPGALPMLQHALAETFDRRQTDVLTRADYEAVGGVTGAVANTAATVLGRLTEEQVRAARQIFLRLVSPGEGTADTRRRVPLAELRQTALAPDDVDGALDAFGVARLLTFDVDPAEEAPTVEIAHEAILGEWPELREWIDRARADILTERRLAALAAEWEAEGHSDGYLLRGPRLAAFTQWRESADLELTGRESEFLAASAAAEAQQQRANVKRRRRVVTALTAATVVSVALAVFAVNRSLQAANDQRLAEVRGLSAQAIAAIENDPELAVLLALEAVATEPIPPAVEALHRAVQANRLVAAYPAEGVAATWIDDDRVATLGADGVITSRVVEGAAEGDHTLVELGDVTPALDLDGNPPVLLASRLSGMLAAGLPDGTVVVIDVATGQILWRDRVGDVTPALSWSNDGRLLAARSLTLAGGPETFAGIVTGRIYEARSGETSFEIPPCDCGSSQLDFAPGTTPRLYTRSQGETEASVVLASYVLENGAWVQESTSLLSPGARDISVGSRRYVVPANSGFEALVIRLNDSELVAVFDRHQASVRDVELGPFQQRAASGGDDGVARVWAVATGNEQLALAGHDEAVVRVEFSPDAKGTRLLTVGAEGTARVWNIGSGGGELGSFPVLRRSARAYFVPDTDPPLVFAVGNFGAGITPRLDQLRGFTTGPLDLLQLADGASRGSPGSRNFRVARHPTSDLYAMVEFDEPSETDGVYLLSWSPLGGPFERPSFQGGVPAEEDWGAPAAAAFNDKGDVLAVARTSGVVTVHDVAVGDPMLSESTSLETRVLTEDDSATPWELSFDGDVLVVARGLTSSERPEARIWDVVSGQQLGAIPLEAETTALAAGGGVVASGNAAGTLRLHRVRDQTLIGEPQFAHVGGVSSIVVKPEDAIVLTAGFDGDVRVWSLETGEQLYTLVSGSGTLQWLDINRDGSQLLVLGGNETIRILALEVDDLVEVAEAQVTRTLTDQECTRYLRTDGCEG